MSGHTPGPWSISDDGDGWITVMAGGPFGKIVANINPESFCAGVADLIEMPAKDNACLIASAPDLLEALQQIVATCRVRIDDPRVVHFDAARAAIAKATGT